MSEREFAAVGLREVLGREPTEAELKAVCEEFARTNIRSVAISAALDRLAGREVEDYSCFRN